MTKQVVLKMFFIAYLTYLINLAIMSEDKKKTTRPENDLILFFKYYLMNYVDTGNSHNWGSKLSDLWIIPNRILQINNS